MPEIRVGVVDTGISGTFNGRIVGGYNFVDNSENYCDIYGHGTKVTGVIMLNTPDNVKVLGYKALTDEGGSISISGYVSVLYMAVADKCRVVNCSFDGGGYNEPIQQAVNYAADNGCILVGSAGNDSENKAHYSGNYDKAISVGALTMNNTIANFSNFGENVDVFAAGHGIKYKTDSGAVTSSFLGTSAASPMVASICAILLSANPEYTTEQLKEAILNTGYSSDEENINEKGRLIANAYEALKYLSETELPQVSLSYKLTRNYETGYTDVTFTADNDATIYYVLGKGGYLYIPYYDQGSVMPQYKSCYKYEKGTTVNLDYNFYTITVCAYAPGKAKSKIEYICAPPLSDESGYALTKVSSTQQYNMINKYQLDEKIVTVPSEIDGCEIQEIGRYCFMGNQTVEKIILPKTVKQIDRYAFANCPNLKEVIAPGVEVCGMYAFYNCANLVNVEMQNITIANTGIFKNCHSLETAKLGTLTEIDNHAFYGCENLKLVKTTKDNISFAVNTFKDCDLLTLYTPSADTSIFMYGKENDIPVIISFNYKLTSIKNGKVTYKDADSDNTAAYKADNLRRMWDIDYVNKGTDCEELAFLFELNDDNIINAKDFAILNKA